MKTSFLLVLSFTLLQSLWTASTAFALGPPVTKLYAKNPAGQTSDEFGEVVAMNDKWIVVGEPSHDGSVQDEGAVHVFDAASGAYVRRISPFAGQANRRFGLAIALDGDRALIGANGSARFYNLRTGKQLLATFPGIPLSTSSFGNAVAMAGRVTVVGELYGAGATSSSGVAHVFNPVTGEYLWPLMSPDGTDGDQFGCSVATDGRVIAVGAKFAKVGSVPMGAVYVFDVLTGVLLRKVSPSDGANSDQFGSSLALGRDRLLVGINSSTKSAGGVYVYNLLTGTETKWLPDDSAPNDYFGISLSASGSRVLIGASGKNTAAPYAGAAYLFDLTSGEQLMRLEPADGKEDDLFGWTGALYEDVAVVGVQRNSDAGYSAGTVYVHRRLAPTLPMKRKASVKGIAPGVVNGVFASLDQWGINNGNDVMLAAGLNGSATKNRGMWSDLSSGQALDLSLRKGDSVGALKVTSVSAPVVNQLNLGLFQVGLAGTGVTVANNRALFADDGVNTFQLLRLGDAVTAFGGAKTSRFIEVVQSSTVFSQALSVKLAQGSAGVTSATDSGLLVLSNAGGTTDSLQEGAGAPGGGQFGEFTRACLTANDPVFTCGLTGLLGKAQGLFTRTGGVNAMIARQGDPAPGAAGALYGVITGETASFSSLPVFRCSLLGAGVTAMNRESLWHKPVAVGAPEKVARAGEGVPGMPAGVKWKRFVQYWGVTATGGGEQVIFMADLAGTGVTAANDRGLWLRLENGTLRLLAREGDGIGDGSGARIQSFQRVVAHPVGGTYAILVSLRNCPPSRNQALLTGFSRQGTLPHAAVREPLLRLRKGQWVQGAAGGMARITSLSLSNTGLDPTGAGGKGLAQQVNGFGHVAIKAGFSDGSVDLLVGPP